MALDMRYDVPGWMQQKESPWAALEAGSRVGAQVMETVNRARQTALETTRLQSQDDLAQKKFELEAQTVGLQNQTRTQEIEATKADLPLWNDFQTKLNGVRTTEELAALEIPAFQHPLNSQRAQAMLNGRSHILSQTAASKAMVSLDAKYDSAIGFDANAVSDLAQYKRYSPEWASALSDWATTAEDVKSRQVEADFAVRQKALTEGKLQVAEIRAQTLVDAALNRGASAAEVAKIRADAMTGVADIRAKSRMDVEIERGNQQRMNIDERGMWGGYLKNLGGRAPNLDTFLRGSVHDILSKDSANRKALMDMMQPVPAAMTYEEAVAHAKKVWDENIGGGSTATPASSNPMPATKDLLKKDVIYDTPRGKALWDGEKFIAQ